MSLFLKSFVPKLRHAWKDRQVLGWSAVLVSAVGVSTQFRKPPPQQVVINNYFVVGGEVLALRSLSLGKKTPEIVKTVDEGTKTSREVETSAQCVQSKNPP